MRVATVYVFNFTNDIVYSRNTLYGKKSHVIYAIFQLELREKVMSTVLSD